MRAHRTTGATQGLDDTLRLRIAEAAARLITEQGIRDFHIAKRKAAAQLGVHSEAALPKNSEVDNALREYQQLFHAHDQPALLHSLRLAAVEAMRFFAAFEPRLVGAVLDGSADRFSAVCLHVFSDEIETIEHFLDEHAIPHEQETRHLQWDRNRAEDLAVFLFAAGGTPIDITVMPRDLLRQAPLDRIDRKPMPRADLAALERLLAQDKVVESAQRLSREM